MATRRPRNTETKAREAEQLAERTDDSGIKEQALKIAEQWQYRPLSKKSLGGLSHYPHPPLDRPRRHRAALSDAVQIEITSPVTAPPRGFLFAFYGHSGLVT